MCFFYVGHYENHSSIKYAVIGIARLSYYFNSHLMKI